MTIFENFAQMTLEHTDNKTIDGEQTSGYSYVNQINDL